LNSSNPRPKAALKNLSQSSQHEEPSNEKLTEPKKFKNTISIEAHGHDKQEHELRIVLF
jgi:hypothetical protein